jgi:hypothetical protein
MESDCIGRDASKGLANIAVEYVKVFGRSSNARKARWFAVLLQAIAPGTSRTGCPFQEEMEIPKE